MLSGIFAFFKTIAAAIGLASKIVEAQKARTERQQGQVEQVAKNQGKVIQDDRKASEARAASDRSSVAGGLLDDDGYKRRE